MTSTREQLREIKEKKKVNNTDGDSYIVLPRVKGSLALERGDAKLGPSAQRPSEDERAESKESGTSMPLLRLVGGLSKKMKRYETRICMGGQIQTNAGVSYIAAWNIIGPGISSTFSYSQVVNAAEFGSLDAIFDEFFIKSSRLRYFPRNKYSCQGASSYNAATAAGAPGFANTQAATVLFLPHNNPVFTTSSSAWISGRSVEQSKVVNMAENWTIVAKNPEKFAWDGPLGDQTTGGTTMSWCQIALTAQYGGRYQLILAEQTGASAGIGTLPESAIMGDFIVEFHIAWRARA